MDPNQQQPNSSYYAVRIPFYSNNNAYSTSQVRKMLHNPKQQSRLHLTPRRGAAAHSKGRNGGSLARVFVCCALVLTIYVVFYSIDVQPYIQVPELMSVSVGGSSIPQNPQPTTSAIQPPPKNNKNKKLESVSCPSQIATRNAPGSIDPNNGMPESPKRLTITDPPFWISLHKAYFDKMRWLSIMEKGNYYETGITDQFHQILANTSRPGLVLDIGMNIGWFTLFARAHGHAVAAFEPNPIMHTRVCESLELNQWHNDSSVQTFPYGLGEQEATLNLTMGNNPGMSSFHEERLAPRHRKQIAVKVVTLDSIALQEGWLDDDPSAPPIYLMKVDVEGYEPFVFGGGKRLLQSGRVENIIMENSVADLRQSVDLLATIYRAGYKVKFLSTAHGDPFRPEMLPQINKELESVSPGMELGGVGKGLSFFAKSRCNVWWTKTKR
jgi:FkbM family methyltransferase